MGWQAYSLVLAGDINGFTVSESVSRSRKGKGEYLNDYENRDMKKELTEYFESKVDVSLIRQGKKQRIATLINEDVLLFAKYLRHEGDSWNSGLTSV